MKVIDRKPSTPYTTKAEKEKEKKREKQGGRDRESVLDGNDDKKRVSLAWAKRMFQTVVIVKPALFGK